MSINSKVSIHLGYFSIAISLFIVEVFIVKYVEGWIRSYLGDVFVVIIIYSAIMSVTRLNKCAVIVGTLLFAVVIEIGQYFKFADMLGFEKGSVAYIVLGNTFSIEDLLCYSLGCFIVYVIDIRIINQGKYHQGISC